MQTDFMLKKSLVFFAMQLLFSLHGWISVAQQVALKLESNVVDVGKIAAIMYPAKTIAFENKGIGKLAILLIEKGLNVKVNFQRKFYQPGEKGIISIYYEPGTFGEINEEIKVFSNLDAEPQTILIKGSCVSIQECFPDRNNLNLRNVLVVNKITQAPVPKAELTFIHNHNTQKQAILKMDKNGKTIQEIPIGFYNISGSVDGYEPYTKELFISKTYPTVLIELTPILPALEQLTVVPEKKQAEKSSVKITSEDLPEDRYAANNIVLLLDVSGSMNEQGKFKLLQQSVNNLVMILRPIDFVSVIVYSTNSKVILPGISGSEKDKIINSVQEIQPHGSTQGVKGLNTAYELAERQFIKGGNNQIILATDGEFSEKNLSDEYYQQFISGYTQKGIKLSILGFGVNKPAIERMKKMTTSGDGSYIHVESEKFVKSALINEIKNRSIMGKGR
jgi:Mg-chelatase subunit ChlD